MGQRNVILALLLCNTVLGLEQAPLSRCFTDGPSGDWNLLKAQRPSKNTSYNLVFDSVASLLQRWPNTRYRNGHNIVPGIIPAGTVLHHGSKSPALPDHPDWVATDPEHSYIFASKPRCMKSDSDEAWPGSKTDLTSIEDDGQLPHLFMNSTCWHLSMGAIRPLKVLYFDGSSGAKLPLRKEPRWTPSTSSSHDDDPVSSFGGGPLDMQDILIWGAVREDKVWSEDERIRDLCAQWGPNGTEVADGEGFDGFVRMQMDFEVMICDFSANFELVTVLQPAFPVRVRAEGEEPLDSFVSTAVIQAGSWHNSAPGETRIILDLPRLVSFFDTDLFPSLVLPRSSQERWEHRLAGISQEDIEKVKHILRANIHSQPNPSGIDWKSQFQVITDRYTERLELTRSLLTAANYSTSDEVVEAAKKIQSVLRIMLHPYIPISFNVAESSSTSRESVAAASSIFQMCSTTNVKYLLKRTDAYTPSERLMVEAIYHTNKEICRVVVKAWARGVSLGLDAVSSPEVTPPVSHVRSLVGEWTEEIAGLMKWLGWSVWHKCRPTCGLEEICYLPTWPLLGPEPLRPTEASPRFKAEENTERSLYLEMNTFHQLQWLSAKPRESGNDPDEGYDWLDPQPRCIRRVTPYELGKY